MKVSKISIDENGRHVIETETKGMIPFRSKTTSRHFLASENLVEDYYQWLELPDKAIVPDALSFQLDAWLRESIAEGKETFSLEADIPKYCDKIILGSGGLRSYEDHEVATPNIDRDVAVARWVIRCLGNDPSSEAQAVVDAIVERRRE